MKVEIYWPEGSDYQRVRDVTTFDSLSSPDGDIIEFFVAVIYYSKKYDVIIDDGKVTFVDKE